MSTFSHYLTESTKSYDYKIKVAGELPEGFANKMETALQKFDVANMSAGKKTPIMTMPLDFPQLSNEEVTIFDVTTNYPVSVRELKEYLGVYMNLPQTHIVVRKPNEPTEEYQTQMDVAKKSEYRNKLHDIEYSDMAKINPEDYHSTKANMGLLKELLKDREENKDHPKGGETGVWSHIEEKGTPSPLSKPSNPHPDPKRK